MKSTETAIYALLLVISLGVAWDAWQGGTDSGGEAADSPIVLFDPGSGGLSELHWQGKKAVATVLFDGKGKKLRSWVSAGKRVKIDGPASPEAAGDDDSAEAEANAKPPEPVYGEPELRSFPGGKQVTELMERFSPLVALRRFEGLEPATITEMGLDEATGSLSAKAASGKTLKLVIGNKAYGSSDTYARDESSDSVYLLSSKVLGSLRSAESRLMERNILGFDPIEATSVVLSSPAGVERALRHEGTHDEENAYWADPSSPNEHESVDAFMKQLFQLRATAYPKDDERLTDTEVETILRASFPGEEKPYLELGRELDTKRSKEDEPAWNWHARTHLTRGIWVKVSRNAGTELSDNMAKVLEP